MSEQQGAQPLPAGTVVDSFTIDQLVRQDRFSACYSATENGRRVLLREFLARDYTLRDGTVPRAREADDRNALRFWMRGFLDQAQQLARLQHPALPRILRAFEANGTAYVAGEPVAGEDLETVLEREGVLDEQRLRKLLLPVLDALELAHTAGILHRDLRPANIVMRADGSGVLLDFAVLRSPVRLKSGLLSAAGTAPYAAPEEATPGATPGPANDVYGIGAVSYRALCGVAPTSAGQRMAGTALVPAAQAARVNASEGLLAAVDEALSLSLDSRPARVAVFRDALRAGTVTAAMPGFDNMVAAPRATKTGGGGGALKIAVPVVLLVVAAGVGYALLGGKSTTTTPAAPASTSAPAEPATRADVPAAAPSPSSTTAPAAASATPPPPDASPGASPLDKLAQDLLVRDRKTQADAKALQEQKDRAEREKKLKDAAEKALAAAGDKPADKPAEKVADKPADKPARAATAPATPSAEESAAARTRALEDEIARLKAERAAPASAPATPADGDAQRAARDKAARDADTAAAAERERQKAVIARAMKNCRIPAPTLSASGNLIYDTAMRVPGAEKVGSAVRLPAFTTADGDTQQFEVMPDSCARKVN